MPQHKLFVLTGATSGLGLEAARSLGRGQANRLIVGARNPEGASTLKAAVRPEQLIVLPVDIASLDSVRDFARRVGEARSGTPISAVALNAGVQIVNGLEMSVDGVEMTFATNHLGHFLLYHELRSALAPGAAIVSTASGTHDPNVDRIQCGINKLFSHCL